MTMVNEIVADLIKTGAVLRTHVVAQTYWRFGPNTPHYRIAVADISIIPEIRRRFVWREQFLSFEINGQHVDETSIC